MTPLRRFIPRLREAEQLDGGGERVDIDVSRRDPVFEDLDLYQRSHWRRYEFACGRIPESGVVADLACGTGYGTALLARRAGHVLGVDVDEKVIDAARRRYRREPRVEFVASDLRELELERKYDAVVSFETLEHFEEHEIQAVLETFAGGLRPGGLVVFSTPYLQERSREAIELGFHRTFHIDERKVEDWLARASLAPVAFHYQDYATHTIRDERGAADFIVGVAERRDG